MLDSYNQTVRPSEIFMDTQEGRQTLGSFLSLEEYTKIQKMAAAHIPAHYLSETMAVLWDIRKHVVEFMSQIEPDHPDTDLSVDAWLETTNYTDAEKQLFREQAEDLNMSRKDKACKCFIKAETYPELKYPRPIKSRSRKFKTKMGPAFARINKALFSLKGKIGREWMAKEWPIDQRMEELMETLKIFLRKILTDFSSFESHFIDVFMYVIEFPFYVWVTCRIKALAEFRKDLETLLQTNECLFKHFKLYCMSRASGEMNTSSGNGWVNLILFTYTSRVKGAVKAAGKFEGDDGATGTLPDEASPTTQDYKDLGWICKLESVTEISHASFCGIVAHPVDKINVCDIRQYVVDFGWTKQAYLNAKQTTILALIRAKGYSAVYQYPACPIIDALGHYALRMTNNDEIKRKFEKMCKNMKFASNRYKAEQFRQLMDRFQMKIPERRLTPPDTRILVQQLYNITVAQQIKIEKYLDEKQDISPLNFDMPVPEEWIKTWNADITYHQKQYHNPQLEITNFKNFISNYDPRQFLIEI